MTHGSMRALAQAAVVDHRSGREPTSAIQHREFLPENLAVKRELLPRVFAAVSSPCHDITTGPCHGLANRVQVVRGVDLHAVSLYPIRQARREPPIAA
jgi:hypothetical protein